MYVGGGKQGKILFLAESKHNKRVKKSKMNPTSRNINHLNLEAFPSPPRSKFDLLGVRSLRVNSHYHNSYSV